MKVLQAAAISLGSYQLQCNDEDWFVLDTQEAGVVTITVNGPTGDLDLFVFDSNGWELASSMGDASQEAVQLYLEDGIALIAVAPYEGMGGSYTLTMDAGDAPAPRPNPNPTPTPGPGPTPNPAPSPAPFPQPSPNPGGGSIMCGVSSPMTMLAMAVGMAGLGSMTRRRRR